LKIIPVEKYNCYFNMESEKGRAGGDSTSSPNVVYSYTTCSEHYLQFLIV
jgi:hypothetical protein